MFIMRSFFGGLKRNKNIGRVPEISILMHKIFVFSIISLVNNDFLAF